MHSTLIKKIAVVIFLLLLVLAVVAIQAQKNYEAYMGTALELESDRIRFEVKSGMNSNSIIEKLVEDNIIEQPYFVKYAVYENNIGAKFKAGEYEIENGITPNELLELLQSHKVIQYRLALIEGWSYLQMIEAIESDVNLVRTLNDYSMVSVAKALNIKETSIEGLFFPDTYLFPSGTTDVEFLHRAHEALNKVLDAEWQTKQEGLPYAKPYDALIMASIVEKETGQASERADIAGVFVKRLNINMLLQTDPTVIYAIGQRFDGNIRKKDLSIDSPYNTYKYKGLPPSPISLVGKEAIHAALNPAQNKFYYFVAKGDGTHYFSEDLKEHNRAVRKYQLKK